MKRILLNAFVLKMIAIVAMVCDHVGAIFFPDHIWLRMIGRLTMPIMCFLLADGYRHTRSVPRYVLRMMFFAVLAAVPYYKLFHTSYASVLVTLSLGLTALWVGDMAPEKRWQGCWALSMLVGAAVVFAVPADMRLWVGVIAATLGLLSGVVYRSLSKSALEDIMENLPILLASLIALLLRADWGFVGVLMVWVFDRYRGRWDKLALSLVGLLAVQVLLATEGGDGRFLERVIAASYRFCVLASIPLLMSYNGKRGPRLKYLFYVFYPLHLWILLGLRAVLR